MFIGRPPGNYDRLLDFSRALTGNLFFVPSATFLDNLGASDADAAASGPEAVTSESKKSNTSRDDGSLSIGSLKGDLPHE
jgi:putative iron-dependent peroxidase